MADFVTVPVSRLDAATLDNLLEEFASRDGTDYGLRESTLQERVMQLRARLASGEAALLFDSDSDSWDILPAPQARNLAGDP